MGWNYLPIPKHQRGNRWSLGMHKLFHPTLYNGCNYPSMSSCHQIGHEQLGDCFTKVSRALQNILSKFVYCRNRTSYENFQLKLCMCAQSKALGTRTKFQLEILTINMISGIVYFREISLKSSRNVSETTPWPLSLLHSPILTQQQLGPKEW